MKPLPQVVDDLAAKEEVILINSQIEWVCLMFGTGLAPMPGKYEKWKIRSDATRARIRRKKSNHC